MIPCQASREAMGNLVYNLGTDYNGKQTGMWSEWVHEP
jgi:hypothetical protein